MKKKSSGFHRLKRLAEKEVNKYFIAIKDNTKYCCACGNNYNMKESKHNHLPFCEKCRAKIITKTFGTVEKKPLRV